MGVRARSFHIKSQDKYKSKTKYIVQIVWYIQDCDRNKIASTYFFQIKEMGLFMIELQRIIVHYTFL